MQSPVRNNYLETEVMTATPQKLQYMLIDAAIRNMQRGKILRSENQPAEACEVLIRAQEIITRILTGLNRELAPDLTRKVASIYMFVFRCLNEAQLANDDSKLDECIRVLEVERETWRLVCKQLEQEQPAEREAARATFSDALRSSTSDSAGSPGTMMPGLDLSSDSVGGEGTSAGFSIEA